MRFILYLLRWVAAAPCFVILLMVYSFMGVFLATLATGITCAIVFYLFDDYIFRRIK